MKRLCRSVMFFTMVWCLPDAEWRTRFLYSSCSLTDNKSNYAQIAKELLAIVFGVDKFESYVYGRMFKGDHKPL